MDELFTRYMYFERVKDGITSPTTEGLRKFYEKDSYKIPKFDIKHIYAKIGEKKEHSLENKKNLESGK